MIDRRDEVFRVSRAECGVFSLGLRSRMTQEQATAFSVQLRAMSRDSDEEEQATAFSVQLRAIRAFPQ
jgi:hypothetical protein